MDELNEKGSLTFQVNGQEVSLGKDDLLIDMAQMEGYVSESGNGMTVVLDTNLTPELVEEGFVREIISKIQTMRKEAGFEVMDKIAVAYAGNDRLAAIFQRNAEDIRREVLAETLEEGELADGYSKEWSINGEHVKLGVKKKGE